MYARMLDEENTKLAMADALKMKPQLSRRLQTDVEFVYYRNTDWFKIMTQGTSQ